MNITFKNDVLNKDVSVTLIGQYVSVTFKFLGIWGNVELFN